MVSGQGSKVTGQGSLINRFSGVMVKESVVKGQWSRIMVRGHCQKSGSLVRDGGSPVKSHRSLVRVTGHWSKVTSQLLRVTGQTNFRGQVSWVKIQWPMVSGQVSYSLVSDQW